MHPEYAGYPGDAVKQADVTLLSYPWEHRQPRRVTRADLDYYVPRTDPGGPSMTDAIHSIVTSALGTPGCAAFTFTRRSVDPFLRPPYDQFAESRSGGAFTFTTGTGGFLQEFLYGYTGFRWRADRVRLDPSLPPQLTGVTASALHWRGRVLRGRGRTAAHPRAPGVGPPGAGRVARRDRAAALDDDAAHTPSRPDAHHQPGPVPTGDRRPRPPPSPPRPPSTGPSPRSGSARPQAPR